MKKMIFIIMLAIASVSCTNATANVTVNEISKEMSSIISGRICEQFELFVYRSEPITTGYYSTIYVNSYNAKENVDIAKWLVQRFNEYKVLEAWTINDKTNDGEVWITSLYRVAVDETEQYYIIFAASNNRLTIAVKYIE